MLAIIINAVAIVFGSLIGLLIKSNIKKAVTDAIMVGIGLFTMYIGIIGLSGGVNAIVYLLAIIIGGVIGTLLKLDERTDKFALKIQEKLTKKDGENCFAIGFTSFFVISCVGAYTIVASFNVGLGDNTMLYTKAAMDFIVSLTMASTLGIGVLFAGIPIILYETALICFSSFLSGILSNPMIEAFSCMGAILTIAIGISVAGIKHFKVVNYVPSLLLAPLIAYIFGFFQ